MATGNIDYSHSKEINHFSQPLNLNIFNSPDVLHCDDNETCLNMQPTIPSKIDSINFDETQTFDGLTSQLNESVHPVLDSNKNNSNSVPASPNQGSSLFSRHARVDDNENLPSQGEFIKSLSCPILQMKKAMPEELFINVDSADSGVHSWRPNVSSDSLCSDFFMTPAIAQDKMDLNVPLQNQNENVDASPLINWSSKIENQPHQLQCQSSDNLSFSPIIHHTRLDIERHMHFQMINLNTVRYELIKSRRRVKELKEEINALTHNLETNQVLRKALSIQKLKEENAELRLECQCLCMEVDYYLKGKALLGEVDENYYHGRTSSEKEPDNQENTRFACLPTHHCNDTCNEEDHCLCNDADDQEDCKKWECHKCTFANHPAINSCEMCHTPRLSNNHIPYAAAVTDACYCHPRENSS